MFKNPPENNFTCLNCGKLVTSVSKKIGTEHRNHCPNCLWSQHVDLKYSGDRRSTCKKGMGPIGLTFKHEGLDKWGKQRQGELMIIHQCISLDKISINRVAADDNQEKILEIFENSKNLDEEMKNQIKNLSIGLLTDENKQEINTQLSGKK